MLDHHELEIKRGISKRRNKAENPGPRVWCLMRVSHLLLSRLLTTESHTRFSPWELQCPFQAKEIWLGTSGADQGKKSKVRLRDKSPGHQRVHKSLTDNLRGYYVQCNYFLERNPRGYLLKLFWWVTNVWINMLSNIFKRLFKDFSDLASVFILQPTEAMWFSS